jgi:hypothetical protein
MALISVSENKRSLLEFMKIKGPDPQLPQRKPVWLSLQDCFFEGKVHVLMASIVRL